MTGTDPIDPKEAAAAAWRAGGYEQNGWGTWYKPARPEAVIGYEYRAYDEDGDLEFCLFRCAYHERAEDWQGEGYRTITVADTWREQFDCDMLGCELNYLRQPMRADAEENPYE